MSKLDRALYARSLECLLEDFEGFCTISDLGIIVNGTQIDHLMVCDTWDGDCAIKFYCGDDPTDEDGYNEEIVLTDEQINGVLDQFLDLI
jgi:hypothetical protein